MATTYTPNLQLPMQEATDPASIALLNEVARKVDAGVAKTWKGKAAFNLLDNSNFLEPVNQRGASSYTANGHTIDRWRDTGNCTTLITAEGLTLQNNRTTSNAYWRQRLPASVLTSGKKYTMAVNIGGVVYCGHAVVNDAAQATFYGENGLYLSCTGLTDSAYWTIQIALSTEKTFTGVRWAALYEGEYTFETLPDYVPKGYAAELAECQRYYWQYQHNNAMAIGKAYMNSSTEALVTFDFPHEMRVAPTMSIADVSTLRLMCIDGMKVPTGYTVNRGTKNQLGVIFTTNSAGTAYTPCVMRSNSGTLIAFSADL